MSKKAMAGGRGETPLFYTSITVLIKVEEHVQEDRGENLISALTAVDILSGQADHTSLETADRPSPGRFARVLVQFQNLKYVLLFKSKQEILTSQVVNYMFTAPEKLYRTCTDLHASC
jgi:hypothetical protein